MYFLVFGEDSFRSRRKLAALRERFSATRDASGMNLSLFTSGDAMEAAEAIRTSPFLAEKKLVVLDGFLRSNTATQTLIEEAVARKPDSANVIFFEDAGAEDLTKSPLFADLKAQKFTEEFAPLAGQAAEKFAQEEAAAAGASFAPRAARLFIELVGGDSWLIHNEAAKLAAFAMAEGDGSVIESHHVRSLVNDGREESLFAFLDACTEGRCADATSMLEKLLYSGSTEAQLITMLTKQFRAAIAARDMADRGRADAATLAKSIGMHPYAATKAIAFARKHSLPALIRRYEQLVTMEHAFKSGGPKSKVTLSLFAAEAAA